MVEYRLLLEKGNAMSLKSQLNIKRIISAVFASLFTVLLFLSFAPASFADTNISAEFVGRRLFSAAQLNEQGFTMEIKLIGASFKPEITEEDRETLLSNLVVDIDDGHIEDGITGNIARLQYIKETRSDVLVPIGTNEAGQPIDSIDRFLSFEQGIPAELIKNAQVYLNDAGHLVIHCDTDYFRHLSNNIIYSNGGVQVAWGDLPIYVTIPQTMIEGAERGILVNDYYAILEMKAHVELLQYEDDDAKAAKDIARIVPVDHLTEADIRLGGKLLKVVIDSRNGPTKWSIQQKRDPVFIRNTFRTERDFGLDDDPEWIKVETQLGATLPMGAAALANWNGYWLSDIIDAKNEKTLEELQEMSFVLELPVVPDFNIVEDQVVYIALLAGMGGGTGRSGAQGAPYWGRDGRLSFTILSGDDADLTTPKQDSEGNDEGINAGTGTGQGNEAGPGDGSEESNTPPPQESQAAPQESESQVPSRPRVQPVRVSESSRSPVPKAPNRSTNTGSESVANRSANTQTVTSTAGANVQPTVPAPNQQQAASAEEQSQGSAGEGIETTDRQLKVYDISDQIVSETRVQRLDYRLEWYLLGVGLLITLGAMHRYAWHSRSGI